LAVSSLQNQVISVASFNLVVAGCNFVSMGGASFFPVIFWS